MHVKYLMIINKSDILPYNNDLGDGDMLFTEDTIGDLFEKEVKNHPDRDFIIYPDRDLRFTYKDFDERVNMFAKGLLSLGITKGDHVGYMG